MQNPTSGYGYINGPLQLGLPSFRYRALQLTRYRGRPQTVCTRWGQDPYARGAYSHIAVGASGADYDALAAPVKNRLFFAGEATNNRHPATMHGAFSSGIREAARIRDLVMAVASPCTHLAPSDYDVPVAATNARWERGEQAHLPFDAAPVPADRQEHRDPKPVPNNVDAVGLRRGSAAGMWPIGARGSLRRSDLPTYLPVDFRRATGLTRGAGLSRSEVTVHSLHNAFEQPDDEFGAFEGAPLFLARCLVAERRDGGAR